MVKRRLKYENYEKTILLTRIVEEKADVFGIAKLPPKMIQIKLDDVTTTLYLVEMIVLPN